MCAGALLCSKINTLPITAENSSCLLKCLLKGNFQTVRTVEILVITYHKKMRYHKQQLGSSRGR